MLYLGKAFHIVNNSQKNECSQQYSEEEDEDSSDCG